MNPKIYWTNWRRNHVTTHVRIHVKSKKGGFLKTFSELLYTLTTYVSRNTDRWRKTSILYKEWCWEYKWSLLGIATYDSSWTQKIIFLLTYPRTRLIEVSMTLVACLLSFLDLLLLLWRCLCTRSGPLDLVRIPSRRSLTSSLTRPCLLTLASSAAVLISLVLIGGTSTFGGGGAFKSPCSEKFQMFT